MVVGGREVSISQLTVPIIVVAVLLSFCGGIVFWLGSLSNRVDSQGKSIADNSLRITAIDNNGSRGLIVIQAKVDDMNKKVDKMASKLDGIQNEIVRRAVNGQSIEKR